MNSLPANSVFDIFLCYRRARAIPAVTLYERLFDAFGQTVFIDHGCLRAGQDWTEQIDEVIAGAGMVVVLLDQDWLHEMERPRVIGATDQVVRELSVALDSGKPLLPVYVDAARAASSAVAEQFPPDSAPRRVVAALSAAHARRWRGASSAADLQQVISDLDAYLPRFGTRLKQRCRIRLDRQLTGADHFGSWSRKFRGLYKAVERPAIETQIRNALAPGQSKLLTVIHAEEGMGKTFTLGRVLRQLIGEGIEPGACARPVLLSEASDPAWRQGFAGGVASLLTEGSAHPDDDVATGRPCLVTKVELELAQATPLLIVIDGLGETDSVNWAELLREAPVTMDRVHPWHLVVTLRTRHWKDRIEQHFDDLRRRASVIEVPWLSDAEFALLADALNFRWGSLHDRAVLQQLRRPRMLAAAAAIPPEQLEGAELTYGLLKLLDLKNRGSGYRQLSVRDFEVVLQDLGRQARAHWRPSRQQLRGALPGLSESQFDIALDELCDAGILYRDGAQIAVREEAACLAVGLHLVSVLRERHSEGDAHAALIEQIAREVLEQQDDGSAQIVSHAMMAVLSERITSDPMPPLNQHEPVLAALYSDWVRRYNRGQQSDLPLRWLLPEMLWLAEEDFALRPERSIVLATSSTLPAGWLEAFHRRLDLWFSGVDLDADVFGRIGNPDRVAERTSWLQEAQAFARLHNVSSERFGVRRLAFEVATVARTDPRDVALLTAVVSVAVQPTQGWDALLEWVQRRVDDWWAVLEEVWVRVNGQLARGGLRDQIARLIYAMWPTARCRDAVKPPTLGPVIRPMLMPGFDKMVDAESRPDSEGLELLLRRIDSTGIDASGVDLGAVALFMPDRLDQLIDDLLEHVLDSSRPIGFLGFALARLAPLLTSAQARRLRVRVSSATGIDHTQHGYLSLASWWSLPETRRSCAVLQHMRALSLSGSELIGASISSATAGGIVARITRGGCPPDRIVFWLVRTIGQANEEAIRTALARELPKLAQGELSEATEYWLLVLCYWVDLAAEAVHLIPHDWLYGSDKSAYIRINDVRSATLAASGTLPTAEMQRRCRSDHWVAKQERHEDQLIAARVAATVARFLSTDYRPGSDDTPTARSLKEAAQRSPELVDKVLAGSDPWRVSRARDLANAIEPADTSRWLELVGAVLEPATHGNLIDGVDARYLIAFKTPDSDAARTIWNGTLEDVEHDADLLQLVIAAMKGCGEDWLRERAQVDPDALPHHQLRAATLAAMMGEDSQRAEIERASHSFGGWIAKGFERALGLFESDRLAQGWYQRFRNAQHWHEAYGSWRMHCECLDLRHQLWDYDTLSPYQLPDAERYERTFRSDVEHARKQRGDKLRKTRFGMDL